MPPRRDNLNSRSNDLDRNFRKAAGSARQLSFAVTGVSGSLSSAVNAAGNLAEQFALITRNAKLAASAAGIGAVLTLGVSIKGVYDKAVQTMKDFNAEINKLGGDLAVLQKQGRGPAQDIEARRTAIENATMEEIAASQRVAKERKFTAEEQLEIEKAIYRKGREARAALDREVARDRAQAFRDEFATAERSLGMSAIEAGALGLGPMARARAVGINQLREEEEAAIDDLMQRSIKAGFSPEQFDALAGRITSDFANRKKILEDQLAEMANEVGQSFVASLAGSIGDGIAVAIRSGSIGEGFKALTGGILIGLGDMMIEIGTQSLLAAKLMSAIVSALRSFSPEGAIGPALALIAAGGVLRGLGASMGGGGSRGASRGGGFVGSTGGGTIIDRGLINPLNPPPNTVGLRALPPIVFAPTIIGPNDPQVNRRLVEMVENGLGRRGGTLG